MNLDSLNKSIEDFAIKYDYETKGTSTSILKACLDSASFVTGILMPEIERLKDAQCFCAGCTKLRKTFIKRNEEIQSMKDENVKIKLESQRYKSELADAKYLLEEDAFENCYEVISNISKALTQKAEE